MGVPLSAVAAMMRSSPPTAVPRIHVSYPPQPNPLRGYIIAPAGATAIGIAMWEAPEGVAWPGPGGLPPRPTRIIDLVGSGGPSGRGGATFSFTRRQGRGTQSIRAWGVAPGGALGPPAHYRSSLAGQF